MSKIAPSKPVIIMFYGFPGAGKSYFANKITDDVQIAHVNGEKIRHQLFEAPRYDKAENEIVDHLMQYMAEEFLSAGVSVVYNTNLAKKAERRAIRDIARAAGAVPILLWLQIDHESAFSRATKRDRRRAEDRYAVPMDRPKFDELSSKMQNPELDEDYVVMSGKHSFPMQRSALLRRLYDLNLLAADTLSSHIVKPGLVNLVPDQARADLARRNITIR